MSLKRVEVIHTHTQISEILNKHAGSLLCTSWFSSSCNVVAMGCYLMLCTQECELVCSNAMTIDLGMVLLS